MLIDVAENYIYFLIRKDVLLLRLVYTNHPEILLRLHGCFMLVLIINFRLIKYFVLALIGLSQAAVWLAGREGRTNSSTSLFACLGNKGCGNEGQKTTDWSILSFAIKD